MTADKDAAGNATGSTGIPASTFADVEKAGEEEAKARDQYLTERQGHGYEPPFETIEARDEARAKEQEAAEKAAKGRKTAEIERTESKTTTAKTSSSGS